MQYTKKPCKNPQCTKLTTNPIFCSRSCSVSHNNRINPKRKPEHKCVKCKNPITAHRKYCDSCKPHRNDWSTVTIDEIQCRESYQKSAPIRHRARKAYRESNLPKCCAICKYDKHYEVCHRKPISDFDPSTLVSIINDISNLIGLCPNHHWELDNGLLTID